jgi:hypothetical protein
LVARLVRNEKVRGSNPLSSTHRRLRAALWFPGPLALPCLTDAVALDPGSARNSSVDPRSTCRGDGRFLVRCCRPRAGCCDVALGQAATPDLGQALCAVARNAGVHDHHLGCRGGDLRARGTQAAVTRVIPGPRSLKGQEPRLPFRGEGGRGSRGSRRLLKPKEPPARTPSGGRGCAGGPLPKRALRVLPPERFLNPDGQ